MSARRSRLLVLVPTLREAELLLGNLGQGLGAPRLATLAGRSVRVALSGCGLAAAGATCGRWFAKLAPDAALLVGSAGTLDPEAFPIGRVMVAESVACDGIGAGDGESFAPLAEPPLPVALAGDGSLAPIALTTPTRRDLVHGALLSVAAAAGSRSQAQARRRRHPQALAEEMEGYAVALAARVARVPLTILRGASNEAGDRDHSGWRMEPALAACRRALDAWIEALPQ